MSNYVPEKDERFTVRFSTADDGDRLVSFFNNNQHSATGLRQEEQYRDRITGGAAIIVANRSDEIVAASMSYPLYDHNKLIGGVPSHEWTEFGSTRALLNGYKLYQLMVAATTLQQFAQEPPRDRFVAEVYTDNIPVCRMLGGDLAWSAIDSAPEALKAASSGTMAQTITKPVQWYECRADHMPHQARVVQEYIDNPVIQRTKRKPDGNGGFVEEVLGQIELDFSRFSLATNQQPFMQQLVALNGRGPTSDFSVLAAGPGTLNQTACDSNQPVPLAALGLRAARSQLLVTPEAKQGAAPRTRQLKPVWA